MSLFDEAKKTLSSVVAISKENPFLPEKKEDFLSLPYGTIIWSNRRLRDEGIGTFLKGHECGPFIVVGRTQFALLCLYGTGVESKNKYVRSKAVLLNQMDYKEILDKDTYFSTLESVEITDDLFIKSLGAINERDKEFLNKRLFINYNRGIYRGRSLEYPNVSINPADVLTNGERLYLVLDVNEEEKTYLLLPMTEAVSQEKININGYEYYYDFANVFQREKIDDMRLFDFISPFDLEKVLAKRKRYLEYVDSKNEINRGTLIRIDGELYYVYGENGDVWLAFKVFYSEEYKEANMAHFTIKGKYYHSDFRKCIELSKKDNDATVVSSALSKEIDNIKNEKKKYIKSNSTKETKSKRYRIDTGDIVQIKTAAGTKYIVVVGNQDDIVAVRSDCLNTGDYSLFALVPGMVRKSGKATNETLRNILVNIKDNTYGWISRERINKLIKKYGE